MPDLRLHKASFFNDLPRPKENRIELSDSARCYTLINHGGSIRIVVPFAVPKESSTVFWTNTQHIYLRANWSLWLPVIPESRRHAEALCQAWSCYLDVLDVNTRTPVSECICPVVYDPDDIALAFATELPKKEDGRGA